MDAKTLVDPSILGGIPAPIWFVELFKWLGFTLHAVPMNLWYAGILVSMLLRAFGGEHGRRVNSRLMAQMPVIIAMGINFGIVPLLFIQLGFGQIFYSATILMAWFWFAVIVILVPAYYGVYLYAFGLAQQAGEMPRWKQAAGWLSALLFLSIGFIFANAMSLMENVKSWPDLWQRHSLSGAAWGRHECRRRAALAPLALDVRPGVDDHGRLDRLRLGLVRPAGESGVSQLGQGGCLEALCVRGGVVRPCGNVVQHRRVATGDAASDVPKPAAGADGGDGRRAGIDVGLAVFRSQARGPDQPRLGVAHRIGAVRCAGAERGQPPGSPAPGI